MSEWIRNYQSIARCRGLNSWLWLVDNESSAFGGSKGTYEGWLRVAKGGFAPSMIMSDKGIQSGVDAL